MPTIIKPKIDLAKIHGAKVLRKDGRLFLELTDSQLYEGKNGALYLDVSMFVTPADTYGNSHRITQDLAKPLRDAGQRGAILGNAKTTSYGNGAQSAPASQPHRQATPPPPPLTNNGADEDVPF